MATILFGCGKSKALHSTYEEKVTITRVDLKDVISQTGEVQPVIRVDIKSEASGQIKDLFVKEGQRINKNDKILIIDTERLINQKVKLDLAVKQALIHKQLSQRDYENARELLGTGSMSKNKLDDLKNNFELANISYEQALLELKDINDQLNKTTIRSPLSGIVTNLFVKNGEIVVSATSGFQGGSPIATVADISKLEVISQIGEVDYIHLSVGQKVIIKPEAVEGTQTNGTISFISLNAKKRNMDELGNFEVRISIDSLVPGIAPGINVNVEFIILEKKHVLGVPNHFVSKTSDGKYFVKTSKTTGTGKDTIIQKQITVGKTDYKYYEILSGLKENDQVVYNPAIDADKNGDAQQNGQ